MLIVEKVRQWQVEGGVRTEGSHDKLAGCTVGGYGHGEALVEGDKKKSMVDS